MTLPLHELAALGTALCWATTGLFAADAVRALGPFYFNLLRQGFVTALLAVIVLLTGARVEPGWPAILTLALSGIIGILIGDTLNFAATSRSGPRRTRGRPALAAPMTGGLGRGAAGAPPVAMAMTQVPVETTANGAGRARRWGRSEALES